MKNEIYRRERISSRYLINNRGQKNFIRYWFPTDQAEAILIFQHGYGEHSGRYEHVARKLNDSGIAMVGYDMEGHGRSPGLLGDIKDIDATAEDLRMVVGELKRQYQNVPVIIGGHSIGGLIAGITASRYPDEVDGLILTSPLLKFASNIPGIVQETAKYVNSMAATMPIISLDFNELGQQPIIDEFKNDNLVHWGKIRARLISQVYEFGNKLATQLKTGLPIPFWLGHGDVDAFANHQISSEIKDENINENSNVNIYQDGLHFLLHENNWQEVVEDMINWINIHFMQTKELNSSR